MMEHKALLISIRALLCSALVTQLGLAQSFIRISGPPESTAINQAYLRHRLLQPDGTLLPYWTMLASGGYPLMLPLANHQPRTLELVALLLHRHAHSPDLAFLKQTILPIAEEVLDRYDRNFLLGPGGALRIDTPQAINPMREAAGLRDVLDRIFYLLEARLTTDLRSQWSQMRSELPPLPVSSEDGPSPRLLSALQQLAPDSSNPELSAIFPFRLYGTGKPDLDMARATFLARRPAPLDPVHAAFLGLAHEARASFTGEFTHAHALALQSMLLQSDYGRIHLFPAWPKEWDADFRLHAESNTVVEATLRRGRITRFRISPSYRARDLVRHNNPLAQHLRINVYP
jgi:alpha-L-fucosidase 2